MHRPKQISKFTLHVAAQRKIPQSTFLKKQTTVDHRINANIFLKHGILKFVWVL